MKIQLVVRRDVYLYPAYETYCGKAGGKPTKGTHQFEQFDLAGFSKDKDYTVTGVSEWLDYESKRPMGWRVDTVITRDDTEYRVKDGQVISNLYQPQTFKCAVKPDVKIGDIVEAVDVMACTLYGQFRNQISIKCQTMRVVTPTVGKVKG